MLKIEFKSKDDPANTLNLFDSLIKDLDKTDVNIKEELNQIGKETELKMKEYITDGKVRPMTDENLSETLEAHINSEFFGDGFGVGDIDELNEHVGYWAAVNWGSSHMVGRRVPNGYFTPGKPNPTPDAFRQGRWKANDLDTGGMAGGNTGFPGSGKGHWSFVVQNPIPPMNYIEKTADWLYGRLDEINFK